MTLREVESRVAEITQGDTIYYADLEHRLYEDLLKYIATGQATQHEAVELATVALQGVTR